MGIMETIRTTLWSQKNALANGDIVNATNQPLVVLASGQPYILNPGENSKTHAKLSGKDVDAFILWKDVENRGGIHTDTTVYKFSDLLSLTITSQNGDLIRDPQGRTLNAQHQRVVDSDIRYLHNDPISSMASATFSPIRRVPPTELMGPIPEGGVAVPELAATQIAMRACATNSDAPSPGNIPRATPCDRKTQR